MPCSGCGISSPYPWATVGTIKVQSAVFAVEQMCPLGKRGAKIHTQLNGHISSTAKTADWTFSVLKHSQVCALHEHYLRRSAPCVGGSVRLVELWVSVQVKHASHASRGVVHAKTLWRCSYGAERHRWWCAAKCDRPYRRCGPAVASTTAS